MKATNPKDAVASGKAKMSLLSPIAKLAWMTAQYLGAKKYGMYNWRGTEVRASVYLDALERHLMAVLSGEWYDPEDGTAHLGNIMACAAIIIDADMTGKLIDDRPIANADYRAALKDAEQIMGGITEKYADKNPHHWTIEDTPDGTPWRHIRPGLRNRGTHPAAGAASSGPEGPTSDPERV